jgi:hypothetical protein
MRTLLKNQMNKMMGKTNLLWLLVDKILLQVNKTSGRSNEEPREQGSLSLSGMSPEDHIIFDEDLDKILQSEKKLSKDARSDALKKYRQAYLNLKCNILLLFKLV